MALFCYECGAPACYCNLEPLHCQCQPLCFDCFVPLDDEVTSGRREEEE